MKTLHAVGEHGSLSAAATNLKTTQAKVSRRLQELEARYGETLVVRGHFGARLKG